MSGNTTEDFLSSTNANDSDGEFGQMSSRAKLFTKVALISLGIIIASSNLFAIICLSQCKRMAIQVRIIVTNMAFTDMTLGIVFIIDPTDLSESVSATSLGMVYCNIRKSAYLALTFVTLFTVDLIAFDRFLCVFIALQYQQFMTKAKCICLCVGSWILASVVSVFTYVFQESESGECISSINIEPIANIVLFSITSVSVTLMFTFYISIIFVVLKKRKQVSIVGDSNSEFKNYLKATVRISTIPLVVVALYSPINMVVLYLMINPEVSADIHSDKIYNIYLGAICCVLLTSLINPYLYALRLTEVRYQMLIILCHCNKKRKQNYISKRNRFVSPFLNDGVTMEEF